MTIEIISYFLVISIIACFVFVVLFCKSEGLKPFIKENWFSILVACLAATAVIYSLTSNITF